MGLRPRLAEDFYVDPDLAKKMSDAIQAHAKAGDYDKLSDGSEFAEKLTSDLRDVSHDKHLRVGFNPFKTPPQHPPTPEDEGRASISRWSTITAHIPEVGDSSRKHWLYQVQRLHGCGLLRFHGECCIRVRDAC